MTFEVGKEYRRRDGEVVKVVEVWESDLYPVRTKDARGVFDSYTLSGRYYHDCTCQYDLIECITGAQPMKFEVGKQYHQRRGTIVTVYEIRNPNETIYPVLAIGENNDTYSYTLRGTYHERALTEYDLVEPAPFVASTVPTPDVVEVQTVRVNGVTFTKATLEAALAKFS